MSRPKITRILVSTLLAAAAIPAALGQDATRSGAQSANQSSPAASASTPSGAPSTGTRTATGDSATSGGHSDAGSSSGRSPTGGDTGALPADPGANASPADAGDSPSAANDSATKPPPVCFKLSGRCVEATKDQAPKAGTPARLVRVAPRPHKGPLNLAAPDVQSVMSADELKEPLPSNEQIAEVQEAATVAIKGDPDAPDVPGGFGAIWWAMNHPSQAWRIFAPAE